MALTRPVQLLMANLDARRVHFLRKRRYAEAFEAQGYDHIGSQLHDCQETEVLACCTTCGKSWYIINRCRLRVCPLCSYTLSMKRAKHLLAMTRKMKFPKFITLTLPYTSTDARADIPKIRHAFNKLRRTELFNPVKGGAYQIELKPKPTGWHVHLHMLIDAPYLPYQKLFSAWCAILDVKYCKTDIRAAKTVKQQTYVTKYAAKSADFKGDPTVVVKWYEATKGLRLFATFGEWYNKKLEDLLAQEDQEKPQSVCPHCKAVKSTFLARDGPFIYGHDDWRQFGACMTMGNPEVRDIEEIRSKVDTAVAAQPRNRQAALAI